MWCLLYITPTPKSFSAARQTSRKKKILFLATFQRRKCVNKMLLDCDKKKRKELSMAALSMSLFHFPLRSADKMKMPREFSESEFSTVENFLSSFAVCLHATACGRVSNSIVWGNIKHKNVSSLDTNFFIVFSSSSPLNERKKVH